jgi:hypothetical protein
MRLEGRLISTTATCTTGDADIDGLCAMIEFRGQSCRVYLARYIDGNHYALKSIDKAQFVTRMTQCDAQSHVLIHD